MAFAIERFVELRPFLYHSTSLSNLGRICATRSLVSASRFLSDSAQSERRAAAVQLEVDGTNVHVQSQRPLIWANVEPEEGWTLPKFVSHLNEFVFFWPGNERGPIPHGQRHFFGNKWPNQQAVTLRIPTKELDLETVELLFCPFNSGSPRCSGGRHSPRGSRTFLPACDFARDASEVIEVVVSGAITLPASTQKSDSPFGVFTAL
jgi:hypothetical protein